MILPITLIKCSRCTPLEEKRAEVEVKRADNVHEMFSYRRWLEKQEMVKRLKRGFSFGCSRGRWAGGSRRSQKGSVGIRGNHD
jgi:hypothetical protein